MQTVEEAIAEAEAAGDALAVQPAIPAAPQSPIITLGEEQVGWSREHKISWLRKKLMQSGCDAIFLTALDEIAWLLNVRGADVEYNPVVLSYLLVTMDDVDWYVRKFPPSRDPETQDSFYELKADGVAVKDYDDVGLDLAALADDDSVGRLWIDPSTLNYNLYKVLESVSADLELVRGRSPIALRKAVKNEVEIAGMKEVGRLYPYTPHALLYFIHRIPVKVILAAKRTPDGNIHVCIIRICKKGDCSSRTGTSDRDGCRSIYRDIKTCRIVFMSSTGCTYGGCSLLMTGYNTICINSSNSLVCT